MLRKNKSIYFICLSFVCHLTSITTIDAAIQTSQETTSSAQTKAPLVIIIHGSAQTIYNQSDCDTLQSNVDDACECCLMTEYSINHPEQTGDAIAQTCITLKKCSDQAVTSLKKTKKIENGSTQNLLTALYDDVIVRPMLFDTTLLQENGNFTEQSLPQFLAQAYRENKLPNPDFSKADCIKAKNLGTQGGNNTLQLFLITSTCKPSQASVYIIKEGGNLHEIERLASLEHVPGMSDLITPKVPKDLPSVALPLVYFAYPDSKKIHYLATMPYAKGKVLSSLITEFRNNQSAQNAEKIKRAFKILGKEIANFHKKFAKTTSGPKLGTTITHGDFHFHNLFFDEIGGHFTLIDNDGMAESIKNPTSPAADLVKLIYIPFGNHGNFLPFGDLIKNIDLNKWFDISFKPFIEGYVDTYKPAEQLQVLQKIKTIFNNPFLQYYEEIPKLPDVKENYPRFVTWSDFDYEKIQTIMKEYINPILDGLITNIEQNRGDGKRIS